MPSGLKRYYGSNQLHFITCSCYHRRPYLNDPARKDEFLIILEELRQTYEFVVIGYVLMPEHFHLLIGEPNRGNPSSVMFTLKQRTSRRWLKLLRKRGIEQFWQRRFYDFNVFNEKKRIEKLKYMHRNPVVRELVSNPEDWPWSSYRHYMLGEKGPVGIGVEVMRELSSAHLFAQKKSIAYGSVSGANRWGTRARNPEQLTVPCSADMRRPPALISHWEN